MGRSTSAAVSPHLTAYAQGQAADIQRANAVAQALCPTVVVPGAAGQYKIYNDRNTFQVYATSRGLGGTARRISWNASDGSFDCKPQALEVTIDDHERERAGDGPLSQGNLEQAKTRGLLSSVALAHAKAIIDYVVANTTAVTDRGNWSNKDIDPIDQLDESLNTLVNNVNSSDYINLVLSLDGWRTIRNHPKVKARTSGVKVAGITVDDLRNLLMIPVNVVIGAVSYNANNEGQATVSKSQLVGSHAILTYSVPSPTVYDPSGFKCFTTGTGNVESVRMYRDETARADVIAIDWSRDIKQTSTLGTIRLALS